MTDATPVRVLLVSTDLMAASRVAGIARTTGADVETLAGPVGTPRGTAFDVVLLDLQSLSGDVTAQVARGRALGGDAAKVVAFGPHVWKERLDAALAAGADLAVSRGTVMEDFASLLARLAPR
jgi:DNA-binding NarL/FixJ family response regulator